MTPKDVINHYGSTTMAAAKLRKSPRCIDNWIAAGEISYWNQCAIQTISGGKLKATPERAKKPRRAA